MKKYLLLLAAVIIVSTAFSQKLPFQGKLIESGTPVNGTRDFVFSIADPAWSETHTGVSVTDGLYFVVLGSINPIPDYLFFVNDEISLSISVDGTALSPVILFKPFSTPYDGYWLNLEGPSDTMNVGPNGWFGNKDGVHTGGFQSSDWGGIGPAGVIQLFGPTTKNFDIISQHWNNADLPMMRLWGSSNQAVAIFSSESDANESGQIKLVDSNENQNYINSRALYFNRTSEGRATMSLWSEDINNKGWAASANFQGPSTTNFEIGADWDNPDRAFLTMNGDTDEQRIRLAIYEDGNQKEHGKIEIRSAANKQAVIEHNQIAFWNTSDPNNWLESMSLRTEDNGQGGDMGVMHLNSGELKSAYVNPREIALRDDANGYNHLVGMSTNNDSGNGWRGNINVNGPTTNNLYLGSKWQNSDMPWMELSGERSGLIQLSGETDANNEIGWMNINSEDGSHAHHNPYGIYINNINGDTTNLEHHSLSFKTGNDQASYNAWGIYSSGHQMHIPNGVEVDSLVRINGTFELNGDFTGTGSDSYTSDKRLKKNFKSLGSNVLEKTMQLNGLSYDWRKDEFPEKHFSDRKQIGVIAQEVEAQFPALVKTNKDGFKSVSYNGLTAVLLEAVKELNAKVEKLENENSKLQAELSSTATQASEIEKIKEQMQMLTRLVQEKNSSNEPIELEVSNPGLK